MATAETSQSSSELVEARPRKFSTVLIALYAFIVSSRILDLSSIARLHLPLVFFIVITLVTLGMLVQRGTRGVFNNKASFCFAALTAWVVVSFPLSMWRAYSQPFVRATLQGLVIFTAVVLIANTMDNWRKIAAAFGYAAFVASLLGLFMGRSDQGRLALGGGSLADPNIFALSLVIGLPFLLYTAWSSSGAKRIALYSSSLLVFYCFARTGSRGGLIALAAMLLVLFVLGKATQKAIMIGLGIVGIVAGSMVLPSYLKDRFTTFFSVRGEATGKMENRLESDVASSEARKDILKQSIHITFQHPLLGVGPGNFPWIAVQQRIQKTGAAGYALVTHNTYTQYSSETGIPGFLFWTGTLFFCTKYMLQVYRRHAEGDPQLTRAARDALAGMAGLAIGSFFLSLGYGLQIPILLGLAVALHNIGEARAAAPQASGAALPAPTAVAVARPVSSQKKWPNRLPPRRPGRPDLSGRPRARNFD